MSRLIEQMNELGKTVDRLRYITQARVGQRKHIFVCEACEVGVYHATPGGLRCRSCGALIPVTWQDGRTPTARELRVWAGLIDPDDLEWDDEDDDPELPEPVPA